jgi:Protein of unknown function (DUF4019)
MRLFLIVVAALMLSGASVGRAQSDSTKPAVTAAQLAAASWLGLVDKGRYGESWDSAATFFRQAVARSSWEAAVASARRPFEPFGERQQVQASFQTRLPNAPPGQYVVLQYRTKTGGGRTVVETVTPMKDSDGNWRVSGYYIRPE